MKGFEVGEGTLWLLGERVVVDFEGHRFGGHRVSDVAEVGECEEG